MTWILNVDDDMDSCEIFTFYMEQYGLSVENALCVREAAEMFDPEKHVAVVTDWNLPDGDGAKVAAAARERSRSVPVIFRSANAMGEIREQAAAFKPLGILQKDGSPDHFEKIANLVDQRDNAERSGA